MTRRIEGVFCVIVGIELNTKEVGTAVTITDILYSPYVHSFISHALRTKCRILLPKMFLKSPGFKRNWNKLIQWLKTVPEISVQCMIYPLYIGL